MAKRTTKAAGKQEQRQAAQTAADLDVLDDDDEDDDEEATVVVSEEEKRTEAAKNARAESQPPAKKRKKMHTAGPKKQGVPDRVDIILDENDDIPPTGLYVGHNGRGYLIPVAQKVSIPYYIKEILDNAVMKKPVFNPQTRQISGWRDQPRYPYRLA